MPNRTAPACATGQSRPNTQSVLQATRKPEPRYRLLHSALITGLLELLPQECVLCGLAADRSFALCRHCEDALPRQIAGCRRCGGEMERCGCQEERCGLEGDHDEINPLCERCSRQDPAFDSCQSLFRYEAGAAWLINRFKYHGDLVAGRILAELLVSNVKHIVSYDCDLVTAVPLHRIRLGQRGFNQSAYLARKLACRLKLPFAPTGLCRTHWTPSQVSLGNARRRERNMRGVFKAAGNAPDLRKRRVLVVDDVVTTQSTLASASKALRAAGCAEVHCITLARADLHD